VTTRLARLPRAARAPRESGPILPDTGALTPEQLGAFLAQAKPRRLNGERLAIRVEDLDIEILTAPFGELVAALASELEALARDYAAELAALPRPDAGGDVIEALPEFGGRGRVREGVERLQRRAEALTQERLARLAEEISTAYGAMHDRRWRRGTAQTFGREVAIEDRGVLLEANRDLVERMQRLPAWLAERTAADLVEAWDGRRSPAEIADILRVRLEVTEAQAQATARDHLLRLNAALTESKLTAIGVTGYVWRTQLDDRVRPHHAEREGKAFRWSGPPDDGHPGEPPNCRCWPEPQIVTDEPS
jgi:SPP1 gp7 family putative phage head morphogenesis protein